MLERRWNADLIAQIFGSVFVISGVLAWTPNPLVSSVGFFVSNAPHTIIHLGVGLLLVAAPFYKISTRSIRIAGFVYAALALLGFALPWPILGLIEMNAAEQWLHVILAALLLFIGYAAPLETATPTPAHF